MMAWVKNNAPNDWVVVIKYENGITIELPCKDDTTAFDLRDAVLRARRPQPTNY